MSVPAKNVSGDYISHHLPVKRFSDLGVKSDLASKDAKVLSSAKSGRPRSSRPMSRERILGAAFLTAGHVFAAYGLYVLYTLPLWTATKWLLATIFSYLFVGTQGITAGAHRLWAHRSYKASLPVRIWLGLMNTMANQASIIHWALEHRVHHRHVDTEADPHNINEGFWHAHMLWLWRPRADAFVAARKKVDCTDLLADPVVYYQDKYYFVLAPFCCFILPGLIGYSIHGEFWRSVLFYGNLRWVITLHATWCVNSVAHVFGERPYRPDELPTENGFVSAISGGKFCHDICWLGQ